MKKNRQHYILLGHPVSHSLSPRMMTAAFKYCKVDAVYKAIDCKENELKKWIGKIRLGEIAGANVTMPYKEVVMKYLDRLTPAAKKIGAVNTIYRRGNKVVGDNTDGLGFLSALHASRFTLHASRAILIGAGGAAKAIAYSLKNQGTRSFTIINRSSQKAKVLSELFKAPTKLFDSMDLVDFVDMRTKRPAKTPDLVINATSLGSPHHPWPSLNFVRRLPKNSVVFDIVTHPTETPLIKAAKKQGLKVIYGREMLLYQGAAAFELWFHRKAPVKVMQKALKHSWLTSRIS